MVYGWGWCNRDDSKLLHIWQIRGGVNNMNLPLILRKKSVRPQLISGQLLCNVIYKVVANILANRSFFYRFISYLDSPTSLSSWLKACVCTSWIEVSINGEVEGFFFPERGLRQGCPMSPYLFIICMEVLFSVLCEGENKRVFGGVKVM